MKRPAIQLYFGDWLRNAKLRRCSWAARGVLLEVMALMHDSDEYGALRWPLAEIAQSVGCPLKLVRELADKGVIKGSDTHVEAYRWAPSHAGRRGSEVVLVPEQEGPLWYSSRMVRDEYKRTNRGIGRRFGPGGKLPTTPPNQSPSGTPSHANGDGKVQPVASPKAAKGYGASSAVALNQPQVEETPTVPSAGTGKTENHGADSPLNGKNRAWCNTPQGIEAEAKREHVSPRLGETHEQLKRRVFEAKAQRSRASGPPATSKPHG